MEMVIEDQYADCVNFHPELVTEMRLLGGSGYSEVLLNKMASWQSCCSEYNVHFLIILVAEFVNIHSV